MQFFIIHPDPKTNAKILPDYAIKQVNVREGWQILSDIGHNLGITWEGQNKPYSIWHAETRRFMVNREAFHHFCRCYDFCLNVYESREWKETTFHNKWIYFIDGDEKAYSRILNAIPESRTHEQFMLDYLIRAKESKMSKSDYHNLLKFKENNK